MLDQPGQKPHKACNCRVACDDLQHTSHVVVHRCAAVLINQSHLSQLSQRRRSSVVDVCVFGGREKGGVLGAFSQSPVICSIDYYIMFILECIHSMNF